MRLIKLTGLTLGIAAGLWAARFGVGDVEKYHGNFCLLYLTATGRVPTSVSHQMSEALKVMGSV